MAWTWSSPQRGTFAAVSALVERQRRAIRTAVYPGKGEGQRTFAIAAWLGFAGAAAPNIPPMAMMALLCTTGAALLLFVALAAADDISCSEPDNADSRSCRPISLSSAGQTTTTRIEELIARPAGGPATDRAAFAKLTAHMSHELRTPLNAILGFSELMSNEVFGPLGSSSYTAYARDIHASGLTLLKSAEDALAITALLTAPEHNRRIRATNAARSMQESLVFHAQTIAARRIDVVSTLDQRAEILSDPQATRQLLINLIDDAVQHAKCGATLAIASRNVGNEFELSITVSETAANQPAEERFTMLLARTLAELCGARLNETHCNGDFQITARFYRATQAELFSFENH